MQAVKIEAEIRPSNIQRRDILFNRESAGKELWSEGGVGQKIYDLMQNPPPPHPERAKQRERDGEKRPVS